MRERFTPCQSKDRSPTITTQRKKENKKQHRRKSNTGSARSFHRDPEREIKVLQYCEVLQRGNVYLYRCATKTPRVALTGTCGTGRAPCIDGTNDYTRSYTAYIVQPQIQDEQYHTQSHPQLRKQAPLTIRSSSLRCVSDAEHLTAEQYSSNPTRKHLQRRYL